MKSLLIVCLLIGISLGAPVEGPGKINDLPTLDPYQPEKPPVVPIKLGHRSKFNHEPFFRGGTTIVSVSTVQPSLNQEFLCT